MDKTKNSLKKRNILIAAMGIGLIGAMGFGGSLAYFTDSQQVENTFTVGNLDIDLKEGGWIDTTDGKNMYPGYTAKKDPTTINVTATEDNPCYFRMIISIKDKDNNPITSQAKLNLIEQIINSDAGKAEKLSESDGNTGVGQYSEKELAAYPMNNPDFTLDTNRSTAGTYIYNYTANNGQLLNAQQSTLFDYISIPYDWNQRQIDTMGEFRINVKAEAIQAKGFTNLADAMNALDSAKTSATEANGHLLEDYKTKTNQTPDTADPWK